MPDAHPLAIPLGQPGSGRLRYSAAMAQYRLGRLSAEALEVFRICAPRDGEDPAGLLAARGLRERGFFWTSNLGPQFSP